MMTFKSRLCSKPRKLYDFKRIRKNQKRYQNAEFHADFNSVEKVFVKMHKKVINKNATKICTFITFTDFL